MVPSWQEHECHGLVADNHRHAAIVAEVEAYDFITGYPERLSFDVADMQ